MTVHQGQEFIRAVRRYRTIGICAFILLVLFLGLLQKQAIGDQLKEWKLLPRPEYFTELYFTDHSTLPTTYVPNRQQTFAFTLHSKESGQKQYRYEVVEMAADKAITLATGTLILQPNQSETVPIRINPVDIGERARIAVRLSEQNQSINYWVTKEK